MRTRLSAVFSATVRRVRIAHVLLIAGCFALVSPLASDRAGAQNLPPDQLLQLLQHQQQQNGSGGLTSRQQLLPQETILEPAAPPAQQLPLSRLEQIMSRRAGVQLLQFGYDQLGIGRSASIPQMGGVQDGYVLGTGDEIEVTLRGQENSQYSAVVDRNGQVLLPKLPPISASGRNFGDFKQDLLAAIHRAYISTEGYISLGQVRQISVLVAGEVNNPGTRIMTGLSTPVDAILISGGVKKTGSLRNVKLIHNGRETTIDLYSVITQHGAASNIMLADGDRVVVPPLGATVAVVGWVRRPGIYEMSPGSSAVTAHNLLSLAGGLEVRGKYRISVLGIAASGQAVMTTAQEGTPLHDSDVLYVQPAADETVGKATLSGGVALAGRYPIVKGTMLSEIIKAPGALGPSPYTLFGVISRRDPKTYLRELVAFSPVAVLNGTADMPLETDDVVRVFSMGESQLMQSTVEKYGEFKQIIDQATRNPNAQTETILRTAFDFDNPDNSLFAANGLSACSQFAQANPGLQSGQSVAAGNSQGQNCNPGQLAFANPQFASTNQTGQIAFSGVQQPMGSFAANQLPQGNTVFCPPQAQGSLTAQQGQIPFAGGQQNMNINPVPNSPNAAARYGQFSDNGAAGSQTALQGLTNQNPGNQILCPQPPFPAAPNLETEAVANGAVPTNEEAVTFGQVAAQLGVTPMVLGNFLSDHRVRVDGAVHGPGLYLVGPDVSLADVVQAAGGTLQWADNSGVELTTTKVDPDTGKAVTNRVSLPLKQGMLANYRVQPQDEFRFRKVFTDVDAGTAIVQGEVRFPGTYRISRGEHLSDLLVRAGGLTDVAYPYGTIFLRRSAAAIERTGFQRAANEVENQMLVAMSRRSDQKLSPDAFTAMQGFVTELRNTPPLGRISIVADPSLLLSKPSLDLLLEPGDVIFVPQRPSTVTILGQVLQPGSVPFHPGMSVDDYISQAGGYAQFADESQTFVILPDGSARKYEASWLNFDEPSIPPGSAIVVPRDLSPLDLHQLLIDTTDIFSKLAVTAASLAVLSRNNP